MSEYPGLQVQTLHGASPQGKPRVFFCCAAADFSRLFEALADEVLAACPNAAIWYLDPARGAMEGEAFLEDLSQMQLLIVPVTTAFLRQDRPDPARTVAFAYAQAHRIPVLPLLQEPGLESAFNALCGDLQVLKRTEQDPTAIPYEEKLRRFLESILVSDALAKRVRDAFDAYIFLSYRKTDRASAQRVMRLIHENEFCRDVAIWYDEFLSPGTDFNDAIRAAISRSRLFALVVTPSLLEDPNYILDTEYPEAMRQQKPVLPLGAEDTDAAAIAALYDGVREITPADDPVLLRERLHALLRGIALRESDDAAHNYLIGIAYLNGIDVEIDHARAAALIRRAAEADLPEAVEKLVGMYRNGEGIERSQRSAISWQARLAELRQRAAEAEPSAETRKALFSALQELARDRHAAGMQEEALEDCARLRACAEDMAAHGDPEALQKRAASLNQTGVVCRALQRPQEAMDWYRQSLEAREQFLREEGTDKARRGLAYTLNQTGIACRALGSVREALGYYERALALREGLAERDPSPRARREVSLTCSQIGIAYRALGDPEQARGWFERAYAIRTALVEEDGAALERRELSSIQNQLGLVCFDLKENEQAHGWFSRAAALREALADEEGTVQARRDLSLSCNQMAKACLRLDRGEEALRWAQKGLALRETLLSELGTTEAQSDLALSQQQMGRASRALGRIEDAVEWIRKALALREQIAERTGTIRARTELANSCETLSSLLQEQGVLAQAIAQLERCVSIRRALCAQSDSAKLRKQCADAERKLEAMRRASETAGPNR